MPIDTGPWPVLLQGWDHRSVWGWDAAEGGYFAQLWRNDRPDDPVADKPHMSLGTFPAPPVPSRDELARHIAAATGAPLHEVDQVMAESMRM